MEDGILAPGGPAYQAFVIPGEFNLTLGAVENLERYTAGGLPIVFSGSISRSYPSGAGPDDAVVEEAIDALLDLDNVHIVADGEVSDLLFSLGLKPRVGANTTGDGTWYTSWRDDADANMAYAYVFNDLHPAEGTLTVQSTGTPWVLDPWTGSQSPLLHYRVEDGQTVIPLNLAGNQTFIVAFSDGETDSGKTPETWFEELPESVINTGVDEDGLYIDVSASAQARQSAKLSSGKTIELSTEAYSAFELTNWTLTVEHWEAPDDLFDASVIARKRNTTHALTDLVSWLDIPELATVSGIGYYTTVLDWPHAPSSIGAYIRFPPALNTIILKVNGKETGPLDLTAPVLDVTPYLQQGENEIVALVPTTMWNYLSTLEDELLSGGVGPLFKNLGLTYARTDQGLVGSVHVVPFQRVRVE